MEPDEKDINVGLLKNIKIRTLHEAHKNLPKNSLKDVNLPDNEKKSKTSIGPQNYCNFNIFCFCALIKN